MAATGRERVVRCKASECHQVIARVTGKTIRPYGDWLIRDGRYEIRCPACGKANRLAISEVEQAA